MSSFATEFPVDPGNSVEDVMRLGCRWLAGSPHTVIPPSELSLIPRDGERTVVHGPEQIVLAHATTVDAEVGGLRYEKTEERLAWTTSIVTLKTSERQILSIQTLCQGLNTAVRLPPPKKPYFIRQALEKLGGGMDGEIPVTDRPFKLTEGEESIAAALILGTGKNTLPIVYVSAGFRGEHQVNSEELARFVSGMAHVVVEPSRAFSHRLKVLAHSRNVYGGTVGVYWPGSEARKSYFVMQERVAPRALEIEIAKDIRIALSNRRQRSNCTWTFVQETLARIKLEQLKAAGSTELKDYIEAFDTELKAKDDRISQAEQEIARLTAEVRRIGSLDQSNASGLLSGGVEHDLYANERRDIVIEALADACRNVRSGSRKEHVLFDVIEANKASGVRSLMAEEVKNLFKTYREMDSRTRNALLKLGFDISEDGKHYKAVFQGDGRYTFTIAKTSSDHRAGKNLASDVNGILF